MGSSSRPTSRSPRRHESKSSGMKPLPRRATTKVPVSSKHRLSIHNPFHHSPSPSTTTNASAPRPQMPNRQNSVQTRYMEMLLNLDTIPRLHNILASFFTWILLAGFLVFPGTFTSISSKLDDDPQFQENGAASDLLKHVKHIPLLYVAAFCSGIGALGMIWMWWRWRENFVWLLNRIFLPGCLNSFAGLISTLINVYSQQDGVWSVTAFVTAAVTGGCMAITGILFALYNFWILSRVKKRHGLEMSQAADHERLVEKIDRKAHEPALEPGSVV